LVDTWCGKFIAKLDALGLAGNTVVFVISDHGTNFCDNPRRVIGKPANGMYPGVMHLPFLMRLPGEPGAGTIRNDLVYNTDLTSTIYALAEIDTADGLDGQNLLPLVGMPGTWKPREYITCRYNRSVCYIDDRTWALGDIDGSPQEVFDLTSDPHCTRNVVDTAEGQRAWKLAWDRLLQDADGSFPDYGELKRTDALGEEPED
jgi:uncharacterized sulfatase